MIILLLGKEDENVVVNISFDKTEDFESKIPIKMYSNSAGYDLFSNIRFEIPKGFYGDIKPRSGLAIKNGLVAFNGTIDSDYVGFVYIIMFNFSDFDFDIKKGDRIAQIIFRKCHSVSFKYCDEVSFDTDRGVKGFGSSGI